MRDPPVKKVLYWCDRCDVPLIGKQCGCGAEGRGISLLPPYDVRPALTADMDRIRMLVTERFGEVPLPKVVLLNKAGGIDRNELVLTHGKQFGWFSFDPVGRTFRFDLQPEALPFILPFATKGIIDLETAIPEKPEGRIGGKKIRVETDVPNGSVIVRYRKRAGTGVLKDGYLRVRELLPIEPGKGQDPGWDLVVERNRYHLKNLERHAIRAIRQHMKDRSKVNVSFSGGKDSTAVLALARKAGVTEAFFIDTGIEFPETVAFVESQGVEIVRRGGDFWSAVEKAGPPAKDHRWCCKLLKLNPLKLYLAEKGPCVTIQGNRWYESWNRADLDITSQNPANPLQLNISPIRNWRALEVFLYLWMMKLPINPLYDLGLERIGCYLCPAMLESEHESLKTLHPEFAGRWTAFLDRWGESRGLPPEYGAWGLWRWKDLPPKMQEICRDRGIRLEERPVARMKKVPSVSESAPPPVIPKSDPPGDAFDEYRKDFSLVSDLIYLDSAATSISPEPVLSAMLDFERNYRANVGRGVHRLSRIATQRYWHAHEKVAGFIGGQKGITVFTRNTTEAINMVARGLPLAKGDRIVTTLLEHHSNFLPWIEKRKTGVEVEIAGIRPDYTLDLESLEELVTDRTKLVAVTHASNAVGVITPVREIARICHDHGALLLVDGSQSVPHFGIDAEELGCDFLCFSGHKMLGPTGTGVLWMKEEGIGPSDLGGGMIETVRVDGYTLAEGYQKFEAGTPNIGGGIALGAAVDYLSGIGMRRIRDHEDRLTRRLIEGLRGVSGVRVFVHDNPANRIGVVSFTLEGLDPHEIAALLDENADIMVRSGHHCCMPLMEHLGLPKGTVRASLYLYSTEFEVDTLVATMSEIAGNAR
jgi:cysteine desulfurase/selenocysteine lyase